MNTGTNFSGSQLESEMNSNASKLHPGLDSVHVHLHPGVRVTCICVYSLITAVGLLGNLTTLYCIFKNRQFFRHTYYCIASTAVGDILLCSVLPFNIVHLVTSEQAVHHVLCHLEAYGSYWASCSSDLSIAFTAFCRYVQVVHFNRVYFFKKSGFLILFLSYSWLIPPLTMIPSFMNSKEKVIYKAGSFACRMNNQDFDSIFMHWNIPLITIPVVVSICYFYIHIYITFRRSRAKVGASQPKEKSDKGVTVKMDKRVPNNSKQISRFNNSANSSGSSVPKVSSTADAPSTSLVPTVTSTALRYKRNERRLTLCILVTCISYILTWALMGTVQLIKRMVEQKAELEVMAIMLVRMGPLIDVIITYSINTGLTEALLQMIRH